MINKFNTWYDGIEEPKRFLVGFGVAMPVFILIAMDNPLLIIMGFFYALFLIFVRIIGSYKT
jgi:hypothetical protein